MLHAGVLSEDALAEFKHEVAVMQVCVRLFAVCSSCCFVQRLRSSYFLSILGACFEQGRYCLVTELAKRGSLFSVLHSKAPLSQELRNRLALESARGLLHLHEAGFTHRDIKSGNVLVSEDWHAKLADFGLTKAKDETKTTTKSSQSHAISLRWTAPELLTLRPNFTNASDVFAFGIVLWVRILRCFSFAHCLHAGNRHAQASLRGRG